ncbi:hypothetical protein D3C81_1920160 [compost metagenome]
MGASSSRAARSPGVVKAGGFSRRTAPFSWSTVATNWEQKKALSRLHARFMATPTNPHTLYLYWSCRWRISSTWRCSRVYTEELTEQRYNAQEASRRRLLFKLSRTKPPINGLLGFLRPKL